MSTPLHVQVPPPPRNQSRLPPSPVVPNTKPPFIHPPPPPILRRLHSPRIGIHGGARESKSRHMSVGAQGSVDYVTARTLLTACEGNRAVAWRWGGVRQCVWVCCSTHSACEGIARGKKQGGTQTTEGHGGYSPPGAPPPHTNSAEDLLLHPTSHVRPPSLHTPTYAPFPSPSSATGHPQMRTHSSSIAPSSTVDSAAAAAAAPVRRTITALHCK